MSDKDKPSKPVDRREVLRKTSAALGVTSITTPTVAATVNEDSGSSDSGGVRNAQCHLCKPTVVASSKDATLLRIPNVEIDGATAQKIVESGKASQKSGLDNTREDNEVKGSEWQIPDYNDEFLARIDKKNRVIDGTIIPTEQLDALVPNHISVSPSGIHLTGTKSMTIQEPLDEYVKDYEAWGEQFGKCNGYMADNHYGAGIALHTGDAWTNLTGAVLGGLLCYVVPGGWLAKIGSQIIGEGACAFIGYNIYNWIGPSSETKCTYGMWDAHRGWGNIEHIVRGRAQEWTTTHSDLNYTYSSPSMHFGAALDNPWVIT